MAISRRPLREDVKAELVRRLVEGSLPAGSDVREAELAEELGVSRTPLREALVTLEEEGFVEARPGRGWWVPPLNERVVLDVYPIIAALEVLAFRLCDPSALFSVVPQLRAVNERMRAAERDAVLAQRIDDEWHMTLLEACANERLLELIASHKLLIHRFEYAYMSAENSVPISAVQHDLIIDAVAAGRFEEAERVLDENWKHGMELLTRWLRRTE
jgi:DNA-binding GntR family transcriptional regulator